MAARGLAPGAPLASRSRGEPRPEQVEREPPGRTSAVRELRSALAVEPGLAAEHRPQEPGPPAWAWVAGPHTGSAGSSAERRGALRSAVVDTRAADTVADRRRPERGAADSIQAAARRRRPGHNRAAERALVGDKPVGRRLAADKPERAHSPAWAGQDREQAAADNHPGPGIPAGADSGACSAETDQNCSYNPSCSRAHCGLNLRSHPAAKVIHRWEYFEFSRVARARHLPALPSGNDTPVAQFR